MAWRLPVFAPNPEGAKISANDTAIAAPLGERHSLLRSGVVVGIGIGAGSVLHSVFHLALARILGPAEYSLLASLLAVVLIATPPTLALQAAVAREVAWRLAREGRSAAGLVLRCTARALLRRALALSALSLLPIVGAILLLGVRDPVPVIATGVALAGMFTLPVVWGGLQGSQQFVDLSIAQVVFASLKLGAGIGVGVLGAGAGSIMLAVAGAALITAGLSFLPLRSMWRSAAGIAAPPRRIVRGFAGGPAAVLTLFALVSGLDVLVARIAFDPDVAGAYSAVSFGARTMLVIPLAVTTVLFPRVAVLADRGSERRHLLGGLVAVAGLGALATAVLFAAPETIIRFAFGADYLQAAPWLGPLGAAMTLFALANVYAFHFLSLGQTQYAVVLGAVALLQFGLYALLHGSPEQLIGVLAISAGLLLVASEAFFVHVGRSPTLRSDFGGEAFRPILARGSAARIEGFEGLVSVVMPAFDEEPRIERAVRETCACMDSFGCSFEIVIVDDGSLDRTREVAENAAREAGGDRVRVIGYERNAGKGAAIVQGARAARGELVLFADADLEVHPRQLQVLFEVLVRDGADVVTGSKLHPDSRVDYPAKRRVVSWCYYAVVRGLFHLPIRDTQTGLKLFRGEVLDAVVPRMLVKRFAYDLEALVIAQRLGYTVAEAPVVVTRERELPRIGSGAVLYTARDTAAVWYRTYLRRYYDRSENPAGYAPHALTRSPR